MKVFIAEDEPPARERLIETLARVAPEAVVLGHADSVRRTADWLASHPPPDLLLLDIQLADGLSLDLFRAQHAQVPVVFTTAYDRFALDAFRALAVDYLLKPVGDAALAAALAKVSLWRAHFAGASTAAQPTWPQRLACRRWDRGAQHVALPLSRLARLVSMDKLTHAVTLDGARYQVEHTLAELEQSLDPAHFFRLNRQVLVAAPAVRHYGPGGKGRLSVVLAPDDETVLVTQERAAAFKDWWAKAPVA